MHQPDVCGVFSQEQKMWLIQGGRLAVNSHTKTAAAVIGATIADCTIQCPTKEATGKRRMLAFTKRLSHNTLQLTSESV